LRGHPCTQAFASPATNLIRPPTEDMISLNSVLLSTGVDEHGCKELCVLLHVKPSVFVRTTDEVHMRNVQHIWKRLESAGFFYWTTFAGWYCATDEAFYADWELANADETGKKVAKTSGNPVEWIEEETCRFSLKQFKPHLHRWLDSGVLPTGSHEHARLLSLTHESLDLLEDPSVSRPATRIYVWFDALISYLTAAGMCSDRLDNLRIWPPTVQFIGKDIMRFHTILWPALLLAVDLPLPQKIIPHAHLLVDGIKARRSLITLYLHFCQSSVPAKPNSSMLFQPLMSKSLGNVLSSSQVIDHFSARMQNAGDTLKTEDRLQTIAADCLRYCLIRSACLNEDSTFNLAHAERIVNSELVNPLDQHPTYVSLSFVYNYVSHTSLQSLYKKFDDLWWHQLLPNRSVDVLQDVLHKTNAFIERHRPWSAGYSHLSRSEVLGICLESLRLIACFLAPIVPRLSSNIFQQLGLGSNDGCRHEAFRPLCKGQHRPLIPRLRTPKN
uniref:Methionine--tRNA ligase, mitochondrial n=1 Tax=Schistocephalus solidus TaxID=70667 RepID=A0A183T6B3_SCHSO